MDFYILYQNSLPIVIAVTVILISIYFLQRNSKCHKVVQEISNNENMKSLTDDKVRYSLIGNRLHLKPFIYYFGIKKQISKISFCN